jgi:hypothetical protein
MAGQRKIEALPTEFATLPKGSKRRPVKPYESSWKDEELLSLRSEAVLRAAAKRIHSFAPSDLAPLFSVEEPETRGGTERRFLNYKGLVNRVVDVFGDDLKASKWLSLANDDFGGKTPLEVAQEADYNVASLEPVLVRIEHGIDF